jgi:class 3 adenylate cyclase
MSGASHFRGHLFADLRGSTAFTERAGNAAGAELVQRFRELVRNEVGSHDGAVVKTEGDSIYIVFPSASTAVMCGLAIVDRATEATAANPDMPMRVGIGVHAGEAIEVAEGGYIGTAVNLAARVCAVAEAGEVLVTGTVRGIAQANIPVTFASRGRRRLKGISEPAELYRVVPQGVAVRSTRHVSRSFLGAAAASVAVIVVAVVALAFVLAPAVPAAATPTPLPAPTAVALATASPAPSSAPRATPRTPQIGALAIAEYLTGVFQPPFVFAVLDEGWSFTGEAGGSASFLFGGDIGGTFDVGRTTTVYSNPCGAGGDTTVVVTSPEELVSSLRAVSFVHLGEEKPIVINGKNGLTFDATIDNGALAACSGPAGSEVAVFPMGRKDFTVPPGQLFRVHALDIGGGNVVVMAFASTFGTEASVNQVEGFFTVAQRLAETVRFQPQ